MDIHVTERAKFKHCRRAWHYQYRQGLVPRESPRDARWLGTAIHVGMAAYYRSEDPVEALRAFFDAAIPDVVWHEMFDEEKVQFAEQRALALSMMDQYATHAARDQHNVLLVETPVRHRIPRTRGWLVGTIDLLVRAKQRLWVWDHKTCTSFADPTHLEMDDQMTSYLWLVKAHYGEVPAGAVYNQLRKKMPAVPYLLKSGKSLSKAKNIDTTAEIYRAAVAEHGFDEADYADILAELELREFIRREPIARNAAELETFEDWLKYEYREMQSKHTPPYPNPSRSCVTCDYRVLCRAENEGSDWQSLRDALYVIGGR